MSKGDLSQIGVKVPSALKEKIEEAVAHDTHLNISDFVRDAIRQKLWRDGFLKENPPDVV